MSLAGKSEGAEGEQVLTTLHSFIRSIYTLIEIQKVKMIKSILKYLSSHTVADFGQIELLVSCNNLSTVTVSFDKEDGGVGVGRSLHLTN